MNLPLLSSLQRSKPLPTRLPTTLSISPPSIASITEIEEGSFSPQRLIRPTAPSATRTASPPARNCSIKMIQPRNLPPRVSPASRPLSLKDKAEVQLESPYSIVRPRSTPPPLPSVTQTPARAPGSRVVSTPLTSKSAPRPNRHVHFVSSEYRRANYQPDHFLLPPAKKTPLHASFLRTDEERQDARASIPDLPVKKPKLHSSENSKVEDGKDSNNNNNNNNTFKKTLSLLHRSLEPTIMIYTISTSTFHRRPRSTKFTTPAHVPPTLELPPQMELPITQPPLLVDGRMLIVSIPRWERKVQIHWRTWNGQKTRLLLRNVKLPKWLWWERNVGWDGKGREIDFFVER